MNQPFGNEKILKILQKSITNNKVAHGYLFCGTDGIGKKLFALHFAKMLNCETNTAIPCENCKQCTKISKGLHPDIKLIQTETKFIKIETIKELSIFSQSQPFEGKFKVAIVDDAHKMNSAASNALLKTLEEPSLHTIIILITSNPKSLLPTIVSRSVKISFSPLDDETLTKILIDKGFSSEKIKEILPLSQGSVKYSLNFLQKENFEMTTAIKNFIKTIDQMDFYQIVSLADTVSQKNKEELLFFILTEYYRTKICDAVTSKEKSTSDEFFASLERFEKTINFARLLRYNISRSFLIETLLLSLKLCEVS